MLKRIVIVDDEVVNLAVLSKLLRDHYAINVYRSGEELLSSIGKIDPPDLILLDIMMTGLDGYETLTRLKDIETVQDVPVIFITALDKDIDEEKAFSLGAVDYITKPFSSLIVLERIRVQLKLKEAKDVLQRQNSWLETEVNRRVRELTLVQDVTTTVITQLVETRDAETGNHILRTRLFIEALAKLLQKHPDFEDYLVDETIALIAQAAPLHDIGKIAIPDRVLLKPGKLDANEFALMKTHCKIGANVIDRTIQEVKLKYSLNDYEHTIVMKYLTIAKNLIEHHHERWDGHGYPDGLKREHIPLEARMMSIVDVMDALLSKRVYKDAWSFVETYEYIKEQGGKQFDPIITNVVLKNFTVFKQIAKDYRD